MRDQLREFGYFKNARVVSSVFGSTVELRSHSWTSRMEFSRVSLVTHLLRWFVS